ncbi:ribbon-helix-helix protein, CopG family [Pseudactinotalea sp. HY160]|uniref:ribbon-helix-helix domain-containing protein n=1 Tax=Pseudactinotalea sp. HY160 TaxID=2654490 RepID=UPI00128B3E28|nr:ribbon-helix-helix domain-containing protein [Pseudactinotalea sp. HY160]MPV51338.1 ribbon-helix-helix protein, CopG family [Pseudactinotalea sp. HY160]
MKITIRLSDEDLAVLDDVVRRADLPSRSAAVRRAIGLLRHSDLEGDYAAAWEEWASSGEETAWAATSEDGLADAPQ